MSDKRWTYQQVTDACETAIRTNLALAQKAATDGQPGVAQIFAHKAEAAFDTWVAIVMGYVVEDDLLRLRALVHAARMAVE